MRDDRADAAEVFADGLDLHHGAHEVFMVALEVADFRIRVIGHAR